MNDECRECCVGPTCVVNKQICRSKISDESIEDNILVQIVHNVTYDQHVFFKQMILCDLSFIRAKALNGLRYGGLVCY